MYTVQQVGVRPGMPPRHAAHSGIGLILMQFRMYHVCLHLLSNSRVFPNLHLIVSKAFRFLVNRIGTGQTDGRTQCNTSSAPYKCILQPLARRKRAIIWALAADASRCAKTAPCTVLLLLELGLQFINSCRDS